MWEFLNEVFRRTLSGFAERLVAFGPDLLAMIVTLVVGVVLAGGGAGRLGHHVTVHSSITTDAVQARQPLLFVIGLTTCR